MKVMVVINPRSGKGRAKGMKGEVMRMAADRGAQVEFRTVAAPGDGQRFAREAVDDGMERIITIGGDGTVNAVASALAGTTLPLGIVPMGSGNGYSRSLGLPQKPIEALELAFSGAARPMDVCYLNDRFFLGTAGIGFDARVAWEFDQSQGRGMWNYARLIIKHVFGAKPMRVVVKANNETCEEQVLMMVFCNTREFGNGALISPGSLPDDGLAELRIVRKPSTLGLFGAFILMYSGRVDRSRHLSSIVTTQAIVHQEGNLAHLDGEPAEVGQELHFRLEPKKLWVITE